MLIHNIRSNCSPDTRGWLPLKLIQENTVYGSDGDISGVAVSTDGGATFTLIGESSGFT